MKKILLIILPFCILFAVQNVSAQTSLALKQLANKNFTPPPVSNNNLLYKPAKKSTGLAIIYSLLLPGMGELYADSYSSGKYFTIAEASLWGIYFGMDTYGRWQKEQYKAFAASNAGVNIAGKNADYFTTISEYMNVDDYNNAKSLERNFNDMFNSPSDSWKWQNSSDRKSYRNMWVTSEQAHNNLRFVVGALILNRIVSAINAARLVAAYNKQNAQELSWNISVGITNPSSYPTGISFNFVKNF